MMMELHGTVAGPRADGDGSRAEQSRPAGVVLRKKTISSNSSFPNTLNGFCTGHLKRNLDYLLIGGEAVRRSQSGMNG